MPTSSTTKSVLGQWPNLTSGWPLSRHCWRATHREYHNAITQQTESYPWDSLRGLSLSRFRLTHLTVGVLSARCAEPGVSDRRLGIAAKPAGHPYMWTIVLKYITPYYIIIYNQLHVYNHHNQCLFILSIQTAFLKATISNGFSQSHNLKLLFSEQGLWNSSSLFLTLPLLLILYSLFISLSFQSLKYTRSLAKTRYTTIKNR